MWNCDYSSPKIWGLIQDFCIWEENTLVFVKWEMCSELPGPLFLKVIFLLYSLYLVWRLLRNFAQATHWESSLKKLFCPHHSFDVTISLSFLLPLLWSTFPDFKRKPLLFFKAPSCLHLCILYCFFLMPPFHLETTSWTWTFHSNKHHS